MSDWRRACYLFGDDHRGPLTVLVPDLYVDTAQLRVRPTHQDPLGTKSRLQAAWYWDVSSHMTLISVSVDGVSSPYMAPQALQVWLCVEYPGVFKVGDSG